MVFGSSKTGGRLNTTNARDFIEEFLDGFTVLVTSGAQSAERVLLWFKGEISVCAAQPDPTRPDPTRPHHAFEKLISLERVDRFTSGLLCSMSPFNKFRI